MRRLQEAGHHPIAVVGGATGLVGDPSGKSAERALNEREVVEGWVERITSQVTRPAALRRRQPGPHREQPGLDARAGHASPSCATSASTSAWRGCWPRSRSARAWTDEGISFTEFSYQILQALDYLELYRRYGDHAADRRLATSGGT